MDKTEFISNRINRIRDVMEIDFTDTDDDAVAIGVSFTKGDLELFALPTIGDGFIAIDLAGFWFEQQYINETIILREP